MAEDRDWTETLRAIVNQMTATGVTELEVRRGGLRIRLRRATEPAAGLVESMRSVGEEHVGESPDHESLHRVQAPLTGIFYGAPNPTAQPYTEPGDWVEESTVVGLIETMKVFNEVMAECRGRVVEILAQQGQLVQSGDPIVLVDTAAVPDAMAEVGQ